MSITLKAATLYGLPVAVGVALLEATTGAGLTGSPLVDGLLGGALVSAVTIGVYKNKVDSLKEDVREIKADLRDLRNHLMGDR